MLQPDKSGLYFNGCTYRPETFEFSDFGYDDGKSGDNVYYTSAFSLNDVSAHDRHVWAHVVC